MKKFGSMMVMAIAVVSNVQAQSYSIQTLDMSGLIYADLGAINSVGQVVGTAKDVNENWSAVVWNAGGELSRLGYAGAVETGAYGINAAGQIVGYEYVPSYSQPVLWQAGSGVGQMLGNGGQQQLIIARDINDHGEAIGTIGVNSGGIEWVVAQDGMSTAYLPINEALAINNSGLIAGARWVNNEPNPVVLDHGVVKNLILPSDALYGRATDLNDAGLVVGYGSTSFNESLAFMWDANGALMLEAKNAYIKSINNKGQAVGGLNGRPSLWENGVATDLSYLLDDQGWQLTHVYLINDLGQIVGGATHDGASFTVLITPVPELSARVLLIMGLMLVVVAVRRRVPEQS